MTDISLHLRCLAIAGITMLVHCIVPELHAQSQVGARVLILVPDVIVQDAQSRMEIRRRDSVALPAEVVNEDMPDEPTNVQLMRANKRVMRRHPSFAIAAAFIFQDVLAYTLYETSPDIVILVDERGRRASVDSLGVVARTDSADYIFALDSLVVGRKRGHWQVSMNIAIYETRTDSVLMMRRVNGGDKNPGDMFACPEGTLGCALSSCTKELWGSTIQAIIGRDPRILRRRSSEHGGGPDR